MGTISNIPEARAETSDGVANQQDQQELGAPWRKIFDNPINRLHFFYGETGLKALERQLEVDGRHMEELLGSGSSAAVFQQQGYRKLAARVDDESHVCLSHVECPVALAHDEGRLYTVEGQRGNQTTRVTTVLKAEKAEDVSLQDIIHVAAIMKSLKFIFDDKDKEDPNKESSRWVDVKEDQFYYVRGQNDEYLTYNNSDDQNSGKRKLLFIGDIASLPAREEDARRFRGQRNVQQCIAEQLFDLEHQGEEVHIEQREIGITAKIDEAERLINEEMRRITPAEIRAYKGQNNIWKQVCAKEYRATAGREHN